MAMNDMSTGYLSGLSKELTISTKEDRFQYDEGRGVTGAIINSIINSTRTGIAHEQADITIDRFFLTLFLSMFYLVFQCLIFALVRNIYKDIYQAKYVLSGQKESKFWLLNLYKKHISEYRKMKDLDGYFFIRFLKFLSFFFFTLSCFHLPILIPLHYHSSKEIHSFSLDKLNMSNVKPNNMTVHLILCIFTVIWFHVLLVGEFHVVFSISREFTLKNKYNTIIYVDKFNYGALKNYNLIEKGCLIRDTCKISEKHQKIYKIWKKVHSLERDIERIMIDIVTEKLFSQPTSTIKYYNGEDTSKCVSKFTKYLILKKNYIFFYLRTMWTRLKSKYHLTSHLSAKEVGNFLSDKKTDHFLTFKYEQLTNTVQKYQNVLQLLREQIVTLQTSIENDIGDQDDCYDKAFLAFDSPSEAYIASLVFNKSELTKNMRTILRPNPNDLIWFNILFSSSVWIEFRKFLATILSVSIIIGWVVPIAFIGIIAHVPDLITSLFQPFTTGLVRSKIFQDIVTYMLPMVTLIFFTEFVPYIFRWLSYMKGCKTGAEIEIDVQNWFFYFLFVHLFVVVTVSSGVSHIIKSLINNPTSIPTILANELPKSSSFFCTFIMMRGMAYFGGNILRVSDLLLQIFYFNFINYTPHIRIERLRNSLYFNWGSIYPLFSVLGCIGIIYSIICPIILPLTCMTFVLTCFSFKYLFEYQYSQENNSETFGKLYPKSLLQLYAGLYFMEFCLLGIFTLSNAYTLSTWMLLILVATIVCHIYISKYLPQFGCYQFDNKPCHLDSTARNNHSILKAFRYPKINRDQRYGEIWLPTDPNGIVDNEIIYMEKRYGIVINTTKCIFDSGGNICLK